MIQRTQIFFEDSLKQKKEKAGITWNEAVELGIDYALNLNKSEKTNGKRK